MRVARVTLKSIFTSAVIAAALGSSIHVHAKAPKAEKPVDKLNRILTIVQDNYIDEGSPESWAKVFNTAQDRVVRKKENVDKVLNDTLMNLDPHSGYLPPRRANTELSDESGATLGPGIFFRNGLSRLLVTPAPGGPAERAGLRDGDTLLAINDKLVGETPDQRSWAIDSIKEKSGVMLKLTVLHKGEKDPVTLRVVTGPYDITPVLVSSIDSDIGYLRFTDFTYEPEGKPNGAALAINAVNKMIKAANGSMKGLIIDLRDNYGGEMDQAVSLAGNFLQKDDVVITTKYRHEKDNEIFRADADSAVDREIQIVILTNENTRSAAEVVSGALQDHHRAVIIGTQTYGKGTVQHWTSLPDNSIVKYTNGRYFTPNGRSLQMNGVVPDILVTVPVDERPDKIEREADLAKTLPFLPAAADGQKSTTECAVTGAVDTKAMDIPMISADGIADYYVLCAVSFLRTQTIPGVIIRPLNPDSSLVETPAPH